MSDFVRVHSVDMLGRRVRVMAVRVPEIAMFSAYDPDLDESGASADRVRSGMGLDLPHGEILLRGSGDVTFRIHADDIQRVNEALGLNQSA